jgi:hypothetical protein
MREIKSYIKTYFANESFERIDDYIYSFLQDRQITKFEYENLRAWAEKWHEIQ